MGVQATVVRPIGAQVAVVLLAASLLTGGCQSTPSIAVNQAAVAAQRQAAEQERDWLSAALLSTLSQDSAQYRVGRGDLLSLQIFALHSATEPATSEIRVQEDGTITLSLLGAVSVEGLTLAEIEAKLNGLYSPRYIKRPSVSAQVAEYRTRSVMVAGEVVEPGVYELNRRQRTALHALLRAGGITEKASEQVRVVRLVPEQLDAADQQPVPVQRQEFLLHLTQKTHVALEQTAAGFELQEGDVLLVEQEPRRVIFVYGLVNAPGSFEINRNQKMTVLQALAMAGGIRDGVTPHAAVLTPKGSPPGSDGVKIDLGDLTEGKQPDLDMGPGDVLNIGHTAGTRVQAFLWHIFNVGVGTTVPVVQ